MNVHRLFAPVLLVGLLAGAGCATPRPASTQAARDSAVDTGIHHGECTTEVWSLVLCKGCPICRLRGTPADMATQEAMLGSGFYDARLFPAFLATREGHQVVWHGRMVQPHWQSPSGHPAQADGRRGPELDIQPDRQDLSEDISSPDAR